MTGEDAWGTPSGNVIKLRHEATKYCTPGPAMHGQYPFAAMQKSSTTVIYRGPPCGELPQRGSLFVASASLCCVFVPEGQPICAWEKQPNRGLGLHDDNNDPKIDTQE
jgi:hypothetical protein